MGVKDESELNRWQRKIFRRIYSARRDGDKWRIRTNKELERIFVELDNVTDIKNIGMENHLSLIHI